MAWLCPSKTTYKHRPTLFLDKLLGGERRGGDWPPGAAVGPWQGKALRWLNGVVGVGGADQHVELRLKHIYSSNHTASRLRSWVGFKYRQGDFTAVVFNLC